jgi:hypothetical protein
MENIRHPWEKEGSGGMSKDFSEDQLLELPAIGLFAELGWRKE